MTPVIHSSQSAERVEIQRAECLRQRFIAPKFHYETSRQADLWAEIHAEFAPPSAMRPSYQAAAESLADQWADPNGTLVSIGCGEGEKDFLILKALPDGTKVVLSDVSEPLVLKAASLAPQSTPLVFDFATADDLPDFINKFAPSPRVFTFFGFIPNYPPQEILPILSSLLDGRNRLLFSANLVPNNIKEILPQYDIAPTRKWLNEFPKTHGAGEGEIKVHAESDGTLDRIVVDYSFSEPCTMSANNEDFRFEAGDVLRLFVSYRYTPKTLTKTLAKNGILVLEQFLSANSEEGVFLCAPQ